MFGQQQQQMEGAARRHDESRAEHERFMNKKILLEKVDKKILTWKKLMGLTWKEKLEDFAGFEKLAEFIVTERLNAGFTTDREMQVYPPPNELFFWTRHCDIQDVKVVIVGQDPFPQPGKAHGLAFSVKGNPQSNHTDSVDNIFKAVRKEYPLFQNPGHKNLTRWAEQGVVLLNSVLTIRQEDTTNLHVGKGWEEFTDYVIEKISECAPCVVFLLWGECGKKKLSEISRARCTIKSEESSESGCTPESKMRSSFDIDKIRGSHLVITSPHPSPKSEYRSFSTLPQFSLANKWLCQHYREPIDWTAL